MIDVPIITKIVEIGVKIWQRHGEKHEEETMRAVLDDLRRSSNAGTGNILRVQAGSQQDRLYQKMVARGYLVKTTLGYMLPEFYKGGF